MYILSKKNNEEFTDDQVIFMQVYLLTKITKTELK